MKKLSYLLLSLLAVALLTACNDSDEPQRKQSLELPISSRAIEGDNVVFSKGVAKVEIDYTDMIIQFTADYKDANGQSRTITTPVMPLTMVSSSVYEFVAATQPIGSDVESLGGYIDFATDVMWYSIHTSSMEVVSIYHLRYAYTTTTVTNPDNGNHYDSNLSAYLFDIDANGETCKMGIINFSPNISGTVEAAEIVYQDLTVTPTVTGYTISADEAESSFRGYYTITDLHFDITSQGQIINGSFKCKDLEFKVSGSMFPSSSSNPSNPSN